MLGELIREIHWVPWDTRANTDSYIVLNEFFFLKTINIAKLNESVAIELGFKLEGTTDLVKLKTKIYIIRIYDNLILFETASNCSKEVHDSTLYVIYGD